MKERPILFSAPMVRALRADTKTQTRRAVKNIPWRPGANPDFSQAQAFSNAGEFRIAGSAELTTGFRCPYGQPGDRLWVRETWMDLWGTGIEHYDPETKRRARYAYGAESPPGSASDEARKDFGLKWRPSIHMPRAACRVVLEITTVRIERLQDISEADAQAEGIRPIALRAGQEWVGPNRYTLEIDGVHYSAPTAAEVFAMLWCDINGAASWAANPLVWVVQFQRVTQS